MPVQLEGPKTPGHHAPATPSAALQEHGAPAEEPSSAELPGRSQVRRRLRAAPSSIRRSYTAQPIRPRHPMVERDGVCALLVARRWGRLAAERANEHGGIDIERGSELREHISRRALLTAKDRPDVRPAHACFVGHPVDRNAATRRGLANPRSDAHAQSLGADRGHGRAYPGRAD